MKKKSIEPTESYTGECWKLNARNLFFLSLSGRRCITTESTYLQR